MIPFAVKDNIDVAGLPTTAACPDYAYVPERSAPVVERLLAAGAILIGKTNLDQFATGLVGVRTPYPVPKNALDPDLVPGGSSSGSAVAVARGLVGFALGTDTAGSGRVPAALNNIVGLKPSLGAISARGVVPACRTLDCVSIFAGSVGDAWRVYEVAAAFDRDDPFSRNLLADWIKKDDRFELSAQPSMGVVCFRFTGAAAPSPRPGTAARGRAGSIDRIDEINSGIVERINASGSAYLTQTKLRGRTIMRIGLGNVLTTEQHLRKGWEIIQDTADAL